MSHQAYLITTIVLHRIQRKSFTFPSSISVCISIKNSFQHLGVEDELVPLVSVSELSRPEPKEGDLVRKVHLLWITDKSTKELRSVPSNGDVIMRTWIQANEIRSPDTVEATAGLLVREARRDNFSLPVRPRMRALMMRRSMSLPLMSVSFKSTQSSAVKHFSSTMLW